MKKILTSALVAGMLLSVGATSVLAMGGASGARTDYIVVNKLGEVVVNPFRIAPLTAIIKDGGYVLKDVTVTIVPKEGGQTISYQVLDSRLKNYGGIPVFGLYPDYQNTVKVSYTKLFKGEQIKEEAEYKIYAPAVFVDPDGTYLQKGGLFSSVDVKKVEKGFEDRLYFFNNLGNKSTKSAKAVWNNPTGGALEWNQTPLVFILDTKGEVRWYLLPVKDLYDIDSAYKAGIMMGFKQNADGAMSWGFGQRYVKYDILGREIFDRKLPASYSDMSHSIDDADNGNFYIRAAGFNVKRPDGKNVHTVRDIIVEVDANGNVLDDWRLFEILDPYRDTVLKVLDQGAVCLNIDASQAGKTMSADDLAALDTNDKFGDIVGSGAGRNWAHVNSVDYDPEDDSIIISSRHQDAIIKIGRDKKVKWILGSHEGWSDRYKKYFLQPVDSKGNKISCGETGSKCPGYENEKGGFDFTWTQHTAFKIDEKSKGDIIYVSAFDNGDTRGMEQPALAEMKYSRSVVYKIDQKKMTVEQIWEFGKERGHSIYSPVTSLTEYQADKNSVVSYFATSGLNIDVVSGLLLSNPSPTIFEHKWGSTEPSVEIQLHDSMGYQAFPFSVNKAFGTK
ncbi:aryl-sulfate sulfotransferase [Campylobacter geochelonis]|uniref:aryl-sulfate sulfotransferase n=1 Tax=Campylobacter geochelonis TaxID=1780362 RepID=UPI00077081FC|nr:aryl-sulfate sulfotransferase [Campylobacter geochelonis]CZE48480.1 arylsulfotransferase [Campylobacter geochelonis]CZE51188.1 arylsulfotransferase [Campylobacter geochelonis]